MGENIESIPFEELIRFLNNGYYLDTFEFGTIKIPPISWPTSSTHSNSHCGFEKPPPPAAANQGKEINKSNSGFEKGDKIGGELRKNVSNRREDVESKEDKKLEGTKRKLRKQNEVIEKQKQKMRSQTIDFLKPKPIEKVLESGFHKSADEGIAEKIVNSDMPPVRKVIKITLVRNQAQTISKKEKNVSCKVKKMVKEVCVSKSSEKIQSEEESEKERKLEVIKRKLRERYEQIENEKKKRRIQITDFVKSQPPCSQPLVKKQQKWKPIQVIRC